MSKVDVSILIPSKQEKFLEPTLQGLLKTAKSNFEIIVHLDGYWPDESEMVYDDRITYLHSGDAPGMRAGINKGAAIAKGDILVKLDGHHIMSDGFDLKLMEHNKPRQIMIMRRKRLDAIAWCEQITSKCDIDYEYLSCPESKGSENDFGGKGLNGRPWDAKSKANIHINPDFNMSFQGSNRAMPKIFFEELGGMDDELWSGFWAEAQELGCGAWLSGFKPVSRGTKVGDNAKDGYMSGTDEGGVEFGTVVTIKDAFAMHLHKGKLHGRMYRLRQSDIDAGRNAAMILYEGKKLFKNQERPLSWLVDFFSPVPTWTDRDLDALKERERKMGWNV